MASLANEAGDHMGTTDTTQQEPSALAHIAKIWREENYQIIVFFAVQVLVGQAGLFFVLLLTYQSSSDLAEVWDSYLRSGGSYVFAIALLSSTCAAIACEFIEALRDKSSVLMLGQKVVWSVAAGLVIFFQAGGLVGPLLVSPATAVADSKVTAETQGPSVRTPNTAAAQKAPIWHCLQIALWVLSTVVAFQLFCLGRAKFLHDRYAKKRSEEVQKLSIQAESQTTTSDGEKI